MRGPTPLRMRVETGAKETGGAVWKVGEEQLRRRWVSGRLRGSCNPPNAVGGGGGRRAHGGRIPELRPASALGSHHAISSSSHPPNSSANKIMGWQARTSAPWRAASGGLDFAV